MTAGGVPPIASFSLALLADLERDERSSHNPKND